MHFGISEGKGGGVKTWKPSVVGYGYFLELPNKIKNKNKDFTHCLYNRSLV